MKENPILCRIKILKSLFVTGISQRRLSEEINVHHNTVGNIVKIFKEKGNSGDKNIIINSSEYDFKYLEQRFTYLNVESRVPLSHSRSIEKDSYIGKKNTQNSCGHKQMIQAYE